MSAKNGVGTRLGSRVCSQYQLMIYTSFSNASVPFASAQLNAARRPNPLHSSVQIGGLGAQADGDTQTQTNTDAHRHTLKVTSQCPPPPNFPHSWWKSGLEFDMQRRGVSLQVGKRASQPRRLPWQPARRNLTPSADVADTLWGGLPWTSPMWENVYI